MGMHLATLILGAVFASSSMADLMPVANPGGPYLIHLGEVLILDGSKSFDPDAPGDFISLYEWDLDHNDTFDISSTSPAHFVT